MRLLRRCWILADLSVSQGAVLRPHSLALHGARSLDRACASAQVPGTHHERAISSTTSTNPTKNMPQKTNGLSDNNNNNYRIATTVGTATTTCGTLFVHASKSRSYAIAVALQALPQAHYEPPPEFSMEELSQTELLRQQHPYAWSAMERTPATERTIAQRTVTDQTPTERTVTDQTPTERPVTELSTAEWKRTTALKESHDDLQAQDHLESMREHLLEHESAYVLLCHWINKFELNISGDSVVGKCPAIRQLTQDEMETALHLFIGRPFYLRAEQLEWVLLNHPQILTANKDGGLVRQTQRLAHGNEQHRFFNFYQSLMTYPGLYHDPAFFNARVDLFTNTYKASPHNMVKLLGKQVNLPMFIGKKSHNRGHTYRHLEATLDMYMRDGDVTIDQVVAACPEALKDSYRGVAHARIAYLRSLSTVIESDDSLSSLLKMTTKQFVTVFCSDDKQVYDCFCTQHGYVDNVVKR